MTASLSRARIASVAAVLSIVTLFGLIAAQDGRAADRIYWTSFDTGTVQWANLDGSGGIHELNPGAATVSPMGYGAGGAIDPVQGRYYWINQYDGKVLWANLDGSGGGDLAIGSATMDSSSYGLSIDPVGHRVYWGTDGSIEYAQLDGSGGGQLGIGEASVNSAIATAVYPATGTVFWANGGSGSNSIYHAKLDGSGGGGLKLSGTGPIEYPFGIAIDAAAQRIYWSNDTGPGSISVANLDGSASAEIDKRGLSLEGGDYGIALDPEAGRVYTARFADDELAYLNTNGTGGATIPVHMPENSGPNFPVVYKEPRVSSTPTLTREPPVLRKSKIHKHGPPALPKLVGSRLSCMGGGFAFDLPEAHLYRAPVTISRVFTRDGQQFAQNYDINHGVASPPVLIPVIANTPGNYRCQYTGTNIAGTTTTQLTPPVAIFKAGKLKLDRKRGTAKVTVELPAEAGTLSLAAKGFKPVSKAAAGTAVVLVKPTGAKKAKLAAKGKLKVIVKLTYTPPGGPPATLGKRLVLKQR